MLFRFTPIPLTKTFCLKQLQFFSNSFHNHLILFCFYHLCSCQKPFFFSFWVTMEFGDDMSLYLRDTWREANTICGVLPMNPSSSGIWPSTKLQDPKANIEFWNYMFPHVEIIFLIVTVLWQFFHFFFKRLGMIRFTSHMLVSKANL